MDEMIDMEGKTKSLAALVEAEWLHDMFDKFALQAVERRIAYSIDRDRIEETMFYLDVYSFVNGSDVLPRPPVQPKPAPYMRAVND
jgi:hypothetical protein